MHPIHDPKAMERSLRQALAERQIAISHGDSLECVARQLGCRDWNTLAARLDPPALRLPAAWTTSGSRTEDYEMGIDEAEGCALIRYRHILPDPTPGGRGSGFGTLMQSIQAEHHVGKRLRLRAELKARDVTGAATIWLRVDGERGRTVAFSNMETRQTDGPLRGTAGWQARAIVLDVPPEGLSIHFGFYLRGGGSVWARRFQLDEVDASVPVTDVDAPRRAIPSNLDFATVA